jgi:hypothetical protein
MTITTTTTTEIRPIADLLHAQLWVHVHINGEKAHSFIWASGPRADVEDYAAGSCTIDELRQRWERKGKR